jgi:hypothetical protein
MLKHHLEKKQLFMLIRALLYVTVKYQSETLVEERVEIMLFVARLITVYKR